MNAEAILSSPASADASGPGPDGCELSVVMPCLNEADTVGTCVRKAWDALRAHGVRGEVIVADNGSTDGSRPIAEAAGARVVPVAERGYGHALMRGIEAARGTYVIMGDADDSYDFGEIPKFLEKLRAGYDLVQGCRFPSGGGRILPGAMPPLHRYWGNPMFSFLARRMFGVPFRDVYCGLRGFSRAFYRRLGLRCTGMEFAVEMIVKSGVFGERSCEVPVTLYRDGRKAHRPHLKTFGDGWRTLKFILLYSPKWLFFVPACCLILAGLAGYGLAMPGYTVLGATLDVHTMLVASLALLLGYQTLVFALSAKVFGVSQGLAPDSPRLSRLMEFLTLERGLWVGAGTVLLGLALLGMAVYGWSQRHFGPLDYAATMRVVIPGVTLVALGFQTLFSICLVNILGMGRK